MAKRGLTRLYDKTGMTTIRYALKHKPMITSLLTDEDMDDLLATSSNISFLLAGDIFSLEKMVARVRDAGKLVFVHFDLIAGIGKDNAGVRFLADQVGADGIVTTRSNIVLASKRHNMMTVQRLFALDSVSIDNGMRVIKTTQPDAIEVLPGIVVPRIIERIHREIDVPVIAGGLITDLFDVEAALACGAVGISTSAKKLWQWQDERLVKNKSQ